METSQGNQLLPHASVTPSLRLLARTLLTFVACYLAALLGGILVITDPQTLWPLWPGCAVLVAILLVSPRKTWPVVIPAGLAGFVLYDLRAGVSLRSLSVLLLADIVEILVAVYGVDYFLNRTPRLDSLKAFARYTLVTVVLGPTLAVLIGVEALNSDRWIGAKIDFFSDALAFLSLAPAILGWVNLVGSRPRPTRAYYAEAAILFAALSSLSFGMFVARTHASPASLYSLVPFLLWSALRFGSAGAGTAVSIVALVSVWGAVHGLGPLSETDPINRVLSLQLFLLFTAVPFMALGVLVEERKRHEAVLLESEERFRLMADHAPTLIWLSGTDKLCTFFNRGWLNFTGRAMEQELGNGWVSGIHPEDRDRCLEVYSLAFDSRADFSVEYRLRRHDGTYRWIADCGVPRFGATGAFCGYIGSCLDITEHKLSEISLHELTGRLIHAQEEERVRIARELHDDISQRMAFLQIGLDQLMLSTPELSPDSRSQLHSLTQVASEMSTDLHSISHQLHPTKLDLQGLVPAMASFCREFSKQHELQAIFVHGDVPGQIPKDVSLCLFRIVQEALRNVVKHSGSSEARVELTSDAQQIVLRVSDCGVGFNPEAAAAKGGIGLVSMRERLRLVNGHLSVESKPSRGARISARVPITAGSLGTYEPKHSTAIA